MQSTILLGFFGSVLVLVHTLLNAKGYKGRAWATAGFLVLLFVVGIVFTFSWQSAYIDHIRGGAPKEYMEVMTAFGLCVYAVDVYVRLFVRNIEGKRSPLKHMLTKA